MRDIPRKGVRAILAKALHHFHEGLPEPGVGVAPARGRARAEDGEDRVDLVRLQTERPQPRLHRQDARVRVALARPAEYLQHADDAGERELIAPRRAGRSMKADVVAALP